MDGTEGLTTRNGCCRSGSPILIPTGDTINGRLFNVTDAIDGFAAGG